MKYLSLILLFAAGLLWSFTSEKKETDFAFISGEKLVYKIYYNWNFVWLSAGEMIFEIKEEKDSYHLEVTAHTFSSYEWFYKVRDKYHSYIDKKTGLPKLYIRDIQQGDYRHYEKIVFDYNKRKATSYTGKSINELTARELPLDKPYYDMISCLYFLRNMNVAEFKKNSKLGFSMILDNEIYELKLKYVEDESKLRIRESGTYKAFKAVGDVIEGNVFKSGMQLSFWIANDPNTLPVMLESPLRVGTIKGILTSHSNLKYPFSAKIK